MKKAKAGVPLLSFVLLLLLEQSVPSSRVSAAVSRIPGDRNSLSSDTYAEIGQNDSKCARPYSVQLSSWL